MKNIPILILHGWNLSSDRFLPLKIEFEKRGYTVFCPDLPGFGENKTPQKPLYLSDYVNFVEKYIEENKLKKITLIGHSFGGRIGIKLAAQNSEYLHALILTGTPGIIPVPKSKVIFFLYLSKVGKIIFSLPILNLFKYKAQKFLYRFAKATDFYNTNEQMRETFKNIVKENLEIYLPEINTPTLLLWGKGDKIVSIDIAEKMNKLIKNSKLVEIKEARHGVPWTHPKEFIKEVDNFLETL